MCDGCYEQGQQIATRLAADTVLAHQYDRGWLACTCGFPAINRPTWAHHVAQLTQGSPA